MTTVSRQKVHRLEIMPSWSAPLVDVEGGVRGRELDERERDSIANFASTRAPLMSDGNLESEGTAL